jgi:hypothetical protein
MEETSMKRYLRLLVVPLAVAVLRTASAQEATTSIPILNPGFEDDVLSCTAASACYVVGSTGWLVGPATATFKPSTTQFSEIPGGVNVAAIGAIVHSTGSILQTLGATVQANTKYTLTLSVGARLDYSFTGYNAALVAGNVTLAQDDTLIPGPGKFLEDMIVYNSGATPPQLGKPLQILIQSKGTGQVAIDNVSLSATP